MNEVLLVQAAEEQESIDKALMEGNYDIIRQCLFDVLLEDSEILGLEKPSALSKLDSPSKVIQKGNIYMYQFVACKKKEINTEEIKTLLQMRINQKLNAFEFPGITQNWFIYKGYAYPIICVDNVLDNGMYVQIDTTWASEKYCDFLTIRKHIKMQQPLDNNHKDRDF